MDICLTVDQTLKTNCILCNYLNLIRSLDNHEYVNIVKNISKIFNNILYTEPYKDNLYYIPLSLDDIKIVFNILDKYKYIVRDIMPKPEIMFIADIIYDIKYQLVLEGNNIS